VASAPLPFGGGCRYKLAVNESTNRVYVTNGCSDTVTVVDGGSAQVVASLTFSGGAGGVAIDSTTNRIYIVYQGGITTLDGNNNTVLSTMNIDFGDLGGFGPRELAFNPNTKRLYVTNEGAPGLIVVDTQTNSVVATIRDVAGFTGVAVNLVTNRVYTFGINGGVAVIDGASNTIIRTVDVMGSTDRIIGGIAVNRATNRVYATDANSSFAYMFDDSQTTSTVRARPILPVPTPTPTVRPAQ